MHDLGKECSFIDLCSFHQILQWACFLKHVVTKLLWNNKISFRLLFLLGNKRDNNEQGTLITCITCLTLMEIKNNWWLL